MEVAPEPMRITLVLGLRRLMIGTTDSARAGDATASSSSTDGRSRRRRRRALTTSRRQDGRSSAAWLRIAWHRRRIRGPATMATESFEMLSTL